eukprot:GHUV01005514.1.p1 GENE.GHUV01005514.1~~GHUV01005514.1.p1  ORF type:complete len:657 (+),score=154.76 GHUV01005514.1:2409-4379(+)
MTSTCSDTCSAHTAAWFALMCLAAQAVAAEPDRCDGAVLQLVIKSSADPAPSTVYGVLAMFGGIPSFNMSEPRRLIAAEPVNACTALQEAQGSLVLVERGNCSFVDKYAAVLAAGGAGMVLYDDIPGCVSMGANASSNSSSSQQRNATQPPAISIDRQDGLSLYKQLQSGASLTLQYQLLDVPALDASALLLWVMAVGTVVAGSLWSGADYALELKGLASGSGQGSRGQGTEHRSEGGMEILEVTTAGALGFVVFSSLMLVLLYFFLSKVFFYIILVGFSIAGAQALGIMLVPFVHWSIPRVACRNVNLPCGWGSVTAAEVVVVPVALAVAVVWAVGRNTSWSWIFQDMLGIAVMLLVLRTLRLPNLKVACVLLPLCFCYDIFWVFLQPLIIGDGESVMVEVAGGAGLHEYLPMLLRVPRLSGPPIIRGAYSLLGFGDIILPGLLVALTRRLDIAGKSSWHGGYYVASVMGYGAGLLLTYVALMFSWFGDQGQPALLYLVPCTLGVVLLLAVVRGELRQLLTSGSDSWGGFGEEDGAAGGPSAGYQAVSSADADDGQHVANRNTGQGSRPSRNSLDTQHQEVGQHGSTGFLPVSSSVVEGQQSGYSQQLVSTAALLLGADGNSSTGTGRSSSRSHSSRGLQGRGSGRSSPRLESFV